MNLVFFDSVKELQTAHAFFPKDELVVAKTTATEKDFQSVQSFAQKNPLQKCCVVLQKPDSKLLHKSRQAGFLVGVLGTGFESSMSACQQKADFLLQPFGFEKPAFDLSVLRVAAQNEVAVGLFFSSLLNASAPERAKWLQNAFFLAKLCQKTKTGLRVFSGARSLEECRSEKDLQAVADFFGQKG